MGGRFCSESKRQILLYPQVRGLASKHAKYLSIFLSEVIRESSRGNPTKPLTQTLNQLRSNINIIMSKLLFITQNICLEL